MMQHQLRSEETSEDDGGGRNYGSAMIPLGEDFEPGDDDVLVGRGKACRNWKGNARFRDLVQCRLNDYSAATSKLEKSAIVTSILFSIRTRTPDGGFIKKDPLTGEWHEVGDFVARERVTQCFRDALHGKYRSSNSSKKKRRREELQKAKEESGSPQQKLKTQDYLRTDHEISEQMSMAGNDGLFLPTRLSGLAPLPPLHFGNFGQQNPTSVASAVMSQPTLPFSNMQSQNMGGSMDSLGNFQQASILERQMAAMQGMDQSHVGLLNQQQLVQQPYPNSWFNMNSQGGPPQSVLDNRLFSMTSMMPHAAVAGQSTMPFVDPASQNSMHAAANNPLLPLSIDSDATATAIGDDNPFEPVPLAEDIVRRHSQAK